VTFEVDEDVLRWALVRALRFAIVSFHFTGAGQGLARGIR
jgi:hypothetical protein